VESTQASFSVSLRHFGRALGGAVAIAGALVLCGWIFHVHVLKILVPGHASMKANAALGMLLGGLAVWLLAPEPLPRAARRAGLALGLAVALLGLGTTAEYLSGVDLRLDQLLFRDPVAGLHPGRMSPSSALTLLLVGCALLLVDWETRRGHRPSQMLALTAALLPLQAIVGYTYGVEPAHAAGETGSLTLHSGVGFALLCAAVLLCRPESGFMRVVSSAGPVGFVARRLLLAVMLLPLVLGWLLLVAGVGSGHETLLGASFMVVSGIVAGGVVVWWNASTLLRMEDDRGHVEESLREQREWFRTTLGSIADAVIACDLRGRVTLMNAVAEGLTGCSEPAASGRPLEEIFKLHGPRGEPLARPVQRVLEAGVVQLPPRSAIDGPAGEVPVEGTAAPIRDRRGRTAGVVLVFRDMSERRRVEEARAAILAREQAARSELERANRAKDEFIATLSHELRTPLNSVLGWARLLRLGKLDGPSTARAVEAIERGATTQAQMVDDLLDVSRIVRGELRLDVRPVEMVPILEAAIDTVRPAAAARGIEIAAAFPPHGGAVAGDAGRLQQVFWNLLTNAVKFTPDGGRVEVRLGSADGRLVVRVKDTGKGIDPEFLPHVFERFRQADSSTTRVHGGMGLGLAIVRHLVEAHGGTVEGESPGPGMGATFSVSLPNVQARSRPRAEPARALLRAAAALSPAPALDGLRVLIVDDDADTLEVIRQLLEHAGAAVHAANCVEDALRSLERHRPDVLVSDIGMPGQDGYSLIRRVRALPPERGGLTPAAALTAFTQTEHRQEALGAGYQLYLAKPIGPAELAAAVARLAGRAAEPESQSA
jgi:PAS domain S-box-containing protein